MVLSVRVQYWLCARVDGYLIFFFKQKTAYELRISDWSSDVCSSDLRNPADSLALPRTSRHDLRLLEQDAFRCPRSIFSLPSSRAPCQGGVEIGRASCRERVCRYV